MGEVSGTGKTGLAAANPDTVASTCVLMAYLANGQVAGEAEIPLGPGEQIAGFLDEFIPNFPTPFQGCFSLKCKGGNIAPLALRQSSDGAFTTVAMGSSQGFTKAYFPQTVRGNSQNTTRILIWNNGSAAARVRVAFSDQNGASQETQDLTVGVNATEEVFLAGENVSATVGSVRVTSNRRVLATAFLRLQGIPEVGVLPVAGVGWWAGVGEVSGGVNTGVSVANSGFSSAACQLTAYTGSGEMARIADISLGPGKQISQFLDELITDLPLPYQGSFSLDCEGGSVVPVALVQRRHDGFLATVAMSPTPEKESIQSERIDGALIYDRNPSTKLGNNVFGSLISDLENDAPGRCTHGGPVCMEYPNGDIAAFYANTSDHTIDGWSEHALSRDGGRTWERYNQFQYSYKAYTTDLRRPAWIEEGLVTENGTAVVFVTHFRNGIRDRSGIMRSSEQGSSWSDYEPLDGDFVGYPCAVAVSGDTNYLLIDSNSGPNFLYVSRDDGRTWQQRSRLTLDNDKWYGAMTIMENDRLLAGPYTTQDEYHFYYCISEDEGHTWGVQSQAYVDKKIRDPELAYLGGKYYLHGRSGSLGEGRGRFVLYQSDNGEVWQSGIVVSGDTRHPDGYSHNCIVNKYNDNVPNELMIEYSIIYSGLDTNEHVFFIRTDPDESKE